MATHELKTHPEPFSRVRSGIKKAELRFDDRDFLIGDTLLLREWKPRAKRYSGRFERRKITDITWLFHWIPDVDSRWCILHLSEKGEQ